MRYWLTSLTMPAFVVVCAMMGCTTEAKPDEKGALARQAVAKAPITNEDVRRDDPPLQKKEIPAKIPVAKDDGIVKVIEPRDVFGNDAAPTEVDPKGLTAAQPKETKKDKKDKTPPKDKTGTTTDPKKEVTVPEPTEYMGKSFADWLKQMKSTPDPTHREEAMKAVLMFGAKKAAEAVPEILNQLERHKKTSVGVDLAVRVNGVMALSTIFRNGNGSPDPEHLKRAFALYKQFLNDDQVIMKVRALQGLPYLGPKAVEAIDDVIRYGVNYKGTWEVRKEAIQTLIVLAPAPDGKGPPNKAAMTSLRIHADYKEGEASYLVRMAAVQGIAMLAQDRVPPELYKALYDPSEQVRLAALRSIAGVAGTLDGKDLLKAKDKDNVVAHLEDFIIAEKDKDKILRIWAFAAIMTVKKEYGSKKYLGPVVKFLSDADPAVRMQALTVIGLCGAKAKPIAYDYVLPLIRDENLGIAGAAMGTLVNIQAIEAIGELKKLAEDKKSDAVRHDTALVAADHLELHLKTQNDKKEKDKKTPDKK